MNPPVSQSTNACVGGCMCESVFRERKGGEKGERKKDNETGFLPLPFHRPGALA